MPYLETVQELLEVKEGEHVQFKEAKNRFDFGYAATPQHKSNLRNIRGTFVAEGMTISKSTRSNLDLIADGQTSYQQVLTELRAKYEEPLSHLL